MIASFIQEQIIAELNNQLTLYINSLNDQVRKFEYELTASETKLKRLERQMTRDLKVKKATEALTNSANIQKRFTVIHRCIPEAPIFDEFFLEPSKFYSDFFTPGSQTAFN